MAIQQPGQTIGATTVIGFSPLVIKGEKGDPGGTSAKGDPGPSPVLQIGTITTVPDGTAASASINNSDPLNPLLNLVLPAGPAGVGSDPNAVQFISQVLSVGQQALARANINAQATVTNCSPATVGYVSTVQADGTLAAQASADVSAQVATAVTAYLATAPAGDVELSAGYLSIGGNNNFAQCPDSAGLRVTGDLDLRLYGTLGSLTASSGFQALIAKQSATATAFMLRETSAGKLQFSGSADGSTLVSTTASASTPAASGYCLQRRQSDGRLQFFKLDPAGATTLTDDGYGTKWTQIGANVTEGTVGYSLYTGGANPPLTVGAVGNGTSGISAGTTVQKVVVRNGLNGTIVANPNFTNHTYSDTSFTDSAPNTWTVTTTGGAPGIVPIAGTVLRSGTTLTFVSPNDSRSGKLRWGAANRNPTTGWFHVDDYGPSGVSPAIWTTAQTGTAARAARDAAVATIDKANGYGATVYFSRPHYILDTDPSITDPYNGLNYCAIKTYDYLEFKGASHYGTVLSIDTAQNCHVFGHPGRLSGDGSQDQIFNVTFTDLVIDGNRVNQDGTHTHDGLHLDQHPGLQLTRTISQNNDGKGYYNTANGEFGTGGVHAVREPVITDCKANGNAATGWYMSATNRATSYKGVYGSTNGSPQARLAGKTVAVPLTGSGNLVVQVDNNSVATVGLTIGDTPASVVTKINTQLGTTLATATNATIKRFRTQITDAVFNGTTTMQSATAAFTAADAGQIVVGAGIPRGTKILAYVDATHVTLTTALSTSSPAVQIGTNLILTASANSATWVAGAAVSGAGIPAGAVIGAVVNGVSLTVVDGSGHPVAPTTASIAGAGVVTINGKGVAALTTRPATMTAATDLVTFTSPHHAVVGSTMVFSGLTGAAGITAGTTYYVHTVPTAYTVTLTTTVGGGGSTLDITSDGSGTVVSGAFSRLLITSDTTGGISKVYLQAGSNGTVLGNLGLTLSPVQANSDFNNYRVGANEYKGFYLDHSECHADGLFADSNYGDGFDIHNVNLCHYDNLHATRNTGLGIYADALCHSTGKGWVSAMNCTDYGSASYRTPTDTAEVYFDNGTEGYGVTHDTTIIGLNAPGDKATIGNDLDNVIANYSVIISSGVAANGDFDLAYAKYGDGGQLGTLRDNR